MKNYEDAATLSLMTHVEQKKKWFFSWNAEHWESLQRAAGFAEFSRRFMAYPCKMIVIEPDFSCFEDKYQQTYAYMSVADKKRWTHAESAFFSRCLAKIGAARGALDINGEPTEIALISSRYWSEDSGFGSRWTKPLDDVESHVEFTSKRCGLERILPPLKRGIGPNEGGIYAPYGGDGVFSLLSM